MRRLGSAGLGYGQVFLLVVGFGLASGLIFLFGIWVGRDVAERRLVQEERVVRQQMPTAPTPNEEAKGGVDLAFYQSLKEKSYARETVAAAIQTPVTPKPAASPTVVAMAQVRAPTVVPPTPAPTHPAPKPTPPPTSTAAKHVERPTPAQQPEATAQRPEEGSEWADAGWTVQVNATTNPEQANDLARRLKAKGYDAYTVQAPLRGQTWYRVRVGRSKSREKAKELEIRLRNTEGMENAYMTPQ